MLAWFAKVLATVGLLVLAGVAGVAGWAQENAQLASEDVLRVDPIDSTALISIAEKRRAAGASSAALRHSAATILFRAPLQDVPLVYLGLAATADVKTEEARKAYSLALRRQPRNISALAWLTSDDIKNNRIGKAAQSLDRLAIFDPDRHSSYAEILSSLVGRDGGEEILEARLASGSKLALSTLERLTATSKDLPLLVRLNAAPGKMQEALVQRVLAEQGAIPAFIAWLSLIPPSDAQALSWPFDPAFVGSPAPGPFNWKLENHAELLSQGGLFVGYSGRESQEFVRQLMILSPGRYRFSAEMDGEQPSSSGGLDWVISCYPGRATVLARIAVSELATTLQRYEGELEVPADDQCAAQYISLRGRPGDILARVQASVRQVALARLPDLE